MKAHTEQEFKTFMSQLMVTNATLDFYTDFHKCHANVKKIAMKLHALNYLVGKENLADAVHDLWEENPSAFSVLDILIAVRRKAKKLALNRLEEPQLIEKFFESEAGVMEFIEDTGLAEVLSGKQVTNLVDYVFGVEVGLDTNARKNRSGEIMARNVAEILTDAGVVFEREVNSRVFPEVHRSLGKDRKRFDFVIRTQDKIYIVEVNFYGDGGSKPNEVARAYTELGKRVNSCDGYEFVWVTDGIGWNAANAMLAEAYYTIPCVFNMTSFKEFVRTLKQ